MTDTTIRVRVWTSDGYTTVDVEGSRVGDDAGVGRPFQISVRSISDVAALGHALIRAAALDQTAERQARRSSL